MKFFVTGVTEDCIDQMNTEFVPYDKVYVFIRGNSVDYLQRLVCQYCLVITNDNRDYIDSYLNSISSERDSYYDSELIYNHLQYELGIPDVCMFHYPKEEISSDVNVMVQFDKLGSNEGIPFSLKVTESLSDGTTRKVSIPLDYDTFQIISDRDILNYLKLSK